MCSHRIFLQDVFHLQLAEPKDTEAGCTSTNYGCTLFFLPSAAAFLFPEGPGGPLRALRGQDALRGPALTAAHAQDHLGGSVQSRPSANLNLTARLDTCSKLPDALPCQGRERSLPGLAQENTGLRHALTSRSRGAMVLRMAWFFL